MIRDKLVDTYKVDDTLGVHHHYKYTFDNLRRLSLEEGFMYNLELSEFIKYFYDNSDRLVKSEFYNHEKTLTSYIDKIYIGTSKLPDEELHYDLNKTLTQTRQLTYDNWENLTEVNVIGQGINCRLFKKIYSRQLLTEEIRYNPYFGCTEWTVTRYEYENN